MLDSLFQDAHHVHRLRANPLGALFDRFAEFLVRRGHTSSSSRPFIRAAEHFGYWLGTHNTSVTADQVTQAAARCFLDEHLPTCSCPVPFPRFRGVARTAINHLLRMLARQSRSLAARSDATRRAAGRVPALPSPHLWAGRPDLPLSAALRPRVSATLLP
jgi:hypothetical protein